jgi:CubicO group peptidase (beta-lactamase class C family)
MRHYVLVPFAATLLGGASSPTSLESPAVLSPAITAPADTLGDRLRRELGPWLDERARTGAFSGVVLIAKDGQPVYSAAYGMADRARAVPNAPDTRFNLGSMNKMWTAIAVTQLVEQGSVATSLLDPSGICQA